ncbi:hypothetical protein GCM10010168_09150 [Actinoplanes ianthinogenes]|uniref:Uncharacterized protein n=1 Tax=Actinoplanes ianthinogenes TaxID=122358 RepID=A0ABM7LXM2_9ACTN|nr:hypothetical protein [Actinoplanes ianthinogenes]BCJ44102.1 hypothetical protein Aiant_47590 [Actinoplanes ianthinogenes]GGQ95815.1 hypothetical protein GCM10010168_09150 [Actinoplanes ianthinogenes]
MKWTMAFLLFAVHMWAQQAAPSDRPRAWAGIAVYAGIAGSVGAILLSLIALVFRVDLLDAAIYGFCVSGIVWSIGWRYSKRG